MNSPYFLIYYNSMQSHFLLALVSEHAWFAALEFGDYNMLLATLCAFAGSTLGLSLTFILGYYISRWRENVPVYSEMLYNKIHKYFSQRLYMLMIIPPILILEMLPGFSLFVLVCGMFRVPPPRAIAAIAVGRILYYSYYLMA